MMKKTKLSKALPSRSGLNELGKTQRTIADYAKRTPLDVAKSTPAAVLNLPQKRLS